MQQRQLGRTDIRTSVFGFGGIVVMNMPAQQAADTVAMAVDGGINYFDVAPSYGNAQYALGPALQPYRNQVGLACKSEKRTAAETTAQLEESLRALRTDHFDVYQLHGLDGEDEFATVTGPVGSLEALTRAKEQGKIRYIGFSCHHEDSGLRLLDAFPFDSVLYPFNWTNLLQRGQGQRLLNKAKERGAGVLALKALAHRSWLEGEEKTYPNCWYRPIYDNERLAHLALMYTLSLGVSSALSPGDKRMLELGMRLVAQHPDLEFTEAMRAELTALAKAQENLIFG